MGVGQLVVVGTGLIIKDCGWVDIINRPGVAGAVLQTASSLIN